MVATPRRSAPDGESSQPVAELGTVSARRGAGARASRQPGRIVRFAMPPLAIMSVVSLAAGLMFLPGGDTADERPGSTATHSSHVGVSRSLARAELSPTPSASPSVLPSGSSPVTQSATPTPSATPSASATPAPSASAPAVSPKPDYSLLGDAAGELYTTSGVHVRTGPGTTFDSLTTVAEGAAVTVTERTVDGWRQIAVGKKAGWIKASLLIKAKPKPTATATATATAGSGASASAPASSDEVSGAKCSKAGGLESNLTAKAAKVLRAVCGKFTKVSSYGGYRPGAGSYHGSGRAIDIMVSGDYGWEIANWARSNAKQLGIIEVIYEQKIWTTQRAGDGWRAMSDRGGATANHYDHVHLSIGG